MTEATLKSALVKVIPEVMPGAVVQRHEDIFRKGGPDMSVTWNKMTSWWEVKFGRPTIKTTGIQRLTCQRLADQGHCYYIIYRQKLVMDLTAEEGEVEKKTVHIQDARSLSEWMSSGNTFDGFNHRVVAAFIMQVHSQEYLRNRR